jgi:hypothetical protein
VLLNKPINKESVTKSVGLLTQLTGILSEVITNRTRVVFEKSQVRIDVVVCECSGVNVTPQFLSNTPARPSRYNAQEAEYCEALNMSL